MCRWALFFIKRLRPIALTHSNRYCTYMAQQQTREETRKGDPAFIISRTEARELNPDLSIPNEHGDDGDVILLCDGCVLIGNTETNIFFDGDDHRATWFERERRFGQRPIIKEEQQ